MIRQDKRATINSWFVLIALCFILTLLDIVVVENYYRPDQAWDKIWVWHRIYLIIFIITPLLASYFFKNLVPLATWFFFLFGLEDTLFYALQGYLPLQYYGVNILWFWEPSLNLGLQMNFLGLTAIALFGIFAAKKSTNLSYHAKTVADKLQQPINTRRRAQN